MNSGFIIFLTTVLSIYTVVNIYIYTAAKRALFIRGTASKIFFCVFIVLFLSYPLGRIFHVYKVFIEKFFINLGSWWLGAMFYLFIFIMLIDVFRLIAVKTGFLPDFFIRNKELTGRVIALAVITIVVCSIIYGFFNAKTIRVTELKIGHENPLSNINIRAVMISDAHLGTIINSTRFYDIKNKINELNPDIVFIVGDLLDENAERLGDFIDDLKEIRSRLGVYGVLGNHEFYAGLESSIEFFKQSGIRLLRNEVVNVEKKFNLIGIDDRTAKRWNLNIPDLSEVVKKADKKLPTILLSHQPVNIDKAAETGINLMLSGHVHGGQLYPVRHITNWIFGLKRRIFKVNDMQVFVSDGVGTWGPPFRIGSVSEIVRIELRDQFSK